MIYVKIGLNQDTLVIDYYHPAVHYPNRVNYYALMAICDVARKNMVSKNSVNPGVVSPEVSSGDFWMKFLDEDERELDSGKMLQNYLNYIGKMLI